MGVNLELDYQRCYEIGDERAVTPGRFKKVYQQYCPGEAEQILMVGAAAGRSVKDLAGVLQESGKLMSSACLTVVDVREEALRSVERALDGQGRIGGVRVITRLDNGTRLSLVSHEFDYWVGDFTLNWVGYEGSGQMLAEAQRVIKPGGVAVNLFKSRSVLAELRPSDGVGLRQIVRPTGEELKFRELDRHWLERRWLAGNSVNYGIDPLGDDAWAVVIKK